MEMDQWPTVGNGSWINWVTIFDVPCRGVAMGDIWVFILPKKLLYPQNKFLATPLVPCASDPLTHDDEITAQ